MFNYDQKFAEMTKMPRYLQIKFQLQQYLSDNNWSFEQAIPSEQELAATYEASVGTIRKAVECLVEEGVLIKFQGKGTFLKHPAFVESSIVRFYLRNAKEGKPEVPTGEIKTIKKVIAEPQIHQLLGVSENTALLYLERVRSVDDKVIVSDKIWLSLERFNTLATLKPEEFENLLYPFYFKKCGQLVTSAKERMSILLHHQDPFLADGQETAMIKVCREAKGLDGNIIEYRESYGLAEDFYYETVIS